jgi:hypothetical protein
VWCFAVLLAGKNKKTLVLSGTRASTPAVPPGLAFQLLERPSLLTHHHAHSPDNGPSPRQRLLVNFRAALLNPFDPASHAALSPSATLWDDPSGCTRFSHRFMADLVNPYLRRVAGECQQGERGGTRGTVFWNRVENSVRYDIRLKPLRL